ncbi:High mobility group B protein 10 [Hibiscus syriacus]|uniref:High mobility group B protein 10 n=1 Tax=Hibiscus syriacus TaxID=106335 RepID=A0A6A3CWM8_HIBSY|nr:high mobility group B protein 10-like [Hibiscus syriacus]KAE8733486.1 High mobility group B protein 10 [Hibiscus syriacus]
MSQHQQQSQSRNGHPSPTVNYDDVVQSPDLFWEKLKAFHKSLGLKFKVPVVGGKDLDLHQLFVEVTSRGGLEKVIKDRRWKEVIMAFRFPTTITSASFVLRKYYLSLLYQFEQVYYFRKQVSSVSTPGSASGSLVTGSANSREDASPNQLAAVGTQELQIGSSVTGIIDGKFDNGYLVTVRVGSDQFKGVLYHIPQMLQLSQSSNTLDVPPLRRKRSRLALQDPSRPKPNRSGYNVFFSEHYDGIKPSYYGEEKVINEKIGNLESNLTEAEKQVYQEKGTKDDERYRTEMLQYRSSHDSTP